MFNRKRKQFLEALKDGEKTFVDEDLSVLNVSGKKIEKASFIHCNLAHTRLTSSKIKGVEFKECNLEEANFEASRLEDVKFIESNLTSCYLNESDITQCKFLEVSSENIMLRDSMIRDSLFCNTNLKGAVFSLCDFKDTKIMDSNLENTDFTYADVKRLNISKCKLSKADFRGAYGLSDETTFFLKGQGAKVTVSNKLKKYISYAILLLVIPFSVKLFISNKISSGRIFQVPTPSEMDYKEFKSYIDKNAFTDNLIINGDFTSGLDWWMSSEDYYKTEGTVEVEDEHFHSAPECIRAVTEATTRIHANHKDRSFSQSTPYVNFTDIKGSKEIALSFWYKLNAPNVYVVVNTKYASGNLISAIDLPCIPEKWNNYSAIVEFPPNVLGFEIEIAFDEGETLIDDVELRVRK